MGRKPGSVNKKKTDAPAEDFFNGGGIKAEVKKTRKARGPNKTRGAFVATSFPMTIQVPAAWLAEQLAARFSDQRVPLHTEMNGVIATRRGRPAKRA